MFSYEDHETALKEGLGKEGEDWHFERGVQLDT